jgi:hypothetical protein
MILNNTHKLTSNKSLLWIYFLISFFVFFFILQLKIKCDLLAHVNVLRNTLKEGLFPFPPLYYFVIWPVVNLDRWTITALYIAFILAIANFFKLQFLLNLTASKTSQESNMNVWIFLMMFSMPIVTYFFDHNHLEAGKYAANNWHNSTTIFSIPFSILLFHKILKIKESPSLRLLGMASFLSLIIALIKPSFLLPLVPGLGLVYLLSIMGFSFFKQPLHILFLLIFNVVLILGVRILLDHQFFGFFDKTNDYSVYIDFFAVTKVYNPNLIAAFVSSCSYVFLILYMGFRYAKLDFALVFSTILLFSAIFIYWTFAEDGPYALHGNFYWQIPIVFIIFKVLSIKFLFEFKNQFPKFLWYFAQGLLLLHILSGVLYLIKLFVFKHYF